MRDNEARARTTNWNLAAPGWRPSGVITVRRRLHHRIPGKFLSLAFGPVRSCSIRDRFRVNAFCVFVCVCVYVCCWDAVEPEADLFVLNRASERARSSSFTPATSLCPVTANVKQVFGVSAGHRSVPITTTGRQRWRTTHDFLLVYLDVLEAAAEGRHNRHDCGGEGRRMASCWQNEPALVAANRPARRQSASNARHPRTNHPLLLLAQMGTECCRTTPFNPNPLLHGVVHGTCVCH